MQLLWAFLQLSGLQRIQVKISSFTLKMFEMGLSDHDPAIICSVYDMHHTALLMYCSAHNIPTEKHGASISVPELRVLLIQHLSNRCCDFEVDDTEHV